MSIHICICTCVCTCIRICVCLCLCRCRCIRIRIHIHVTCSLPCPGVLAPLCCICLYMLAGDSSSDHKHTPQTLNEKSPSWDEGLLISTAFLIFWWLRPILLRVWGLECKRSLQEDFGNSDKKSLDITCLSLSSCSQGCLVVGMWCRWRKTVCTIAVALLACRVIYM